MLLVLRLDTGFAGLVSSTHLHSEHSSSFQNNAVLTNKVKRSAANEPFTDRIKVTVPCSNFGGCFSRHS